MHWQLPISSITVVSAMSFLATRWPKRMNSETGTSMRNWDKSLSKRFVHSMQRTVSDLTSIIWSMHLTAALSASVLNSALGQNSGRRGDGIKLHTQLDLRGNLPVFVLLTKASVHDVKAMDEICIEMGAIYLIDKGYVDFSRLFNIIHKNGAFFVTRAKDNMQYEVVKSMPVDKQTGVISDEIVRLTKENSKQKYPEDFRMVVYEDFTTGKVYRFITNHLGYEALTIAELYRERWNVELFFKWIKQHLHIKSFYGTSENAVYTQIWIAVCAFLLLAIAKKRMHIEEPSLYMISQTIGTMLFEKTPIPELFNKPINNVSKDDGQLDLFRDLKF